MVTLEELAPLWAPKIKSGNLNPTRQLNLADPDKCFVSEAHGFKNKYYIRGEIGYCSSCANFGQTYVMLQVVKQHSLIASIPRHRNL